MSFPRKRQSRLLCTHPPCHPCASRNPVRLSPPRERPAVPKAPPGEGATVSFLHKQELRLLCTTPRVTAAQAAVQNNAGFPRTASYPAALKQAHSSLHCSSRRSVPSASSFGYTVPLRRTGHGRCSAHGSSAHGSAGFFRAVWINQATMWRRPLGEEMLIFSTISHQRADDVP